VTDSWYFRRVLLSLTDCNQCPNAAIRSERLLRWSVVAFCCFQVADAKQHFELVKCSGFEESENALRTNFKDGHFGLPKYYVTPL
jgi:hypothetical protein